MVRVEGPEARRFLDGLLSQDLAGLHPVRAVRSFLLSPQGKLRALLWVAGEPERVDLFTDAAVGSRVAADLAHYKIRVKATIAPPIPALAFLDDMPEGAVMAPLGDHARGFTTVGSGWSKFEPELWDSARIEAGEPIMDRDVDEKTIPQETGLVGEAVSFEKGCYLGQELVARLDSRQGRVNRNLRRVEIDGPVLAPAAVTADGETVGNLTSIANGGGRVLGLGLLHRDVEDGDTVAVGDRIGTVLGAHI